MRQGKVELYKPKRVIDLKKGGVYLQFYNVKEASVILHLQPITVRKYCTEKIINAALVGNKYLIKEDDLIDFINKGKKL